MIHILQKKILIVCLIILNCVVLILPLSNAPLGSPLNFFFKILGGGQSPPRIAQGGAPPPWPPPGYASVVWYSFFF